MTEHLSSEDNQLQACADALNDFQSNLNETDRNQYASHIRFVFAVEIQARQTITMVSSSVEHQIADMKQRLKHTEQVTIEHDTDYRQFEEKLYGFQSNVNELGQRLGSRVKQITIDDIGLIDVSTFSKTC